MDAFAISFYARARKGALDWTKQYDQYKAIQVGVIANWHRQGYLDYLASALLDLGEGMLCPIDESWRNRYLADLKCGVRHLVLIGALRQGDVVMDWLNFTFGLFLFNEALPLHLKNRLCVPPYGVGLACFASSLLRSLDPFGL